MILSSIARAFRYAAKVTDKIGRVIYTDEASKRIKKWYADPNNLLYRTDYVLGRDAVIFDLGGFEGQWASDMYSRFLCTIYVFEPVPQYAEAIVERFKYNPQIKIYPVGLSESNMEAEIAVQSEGSSTLNVRNDSQKIKIKLKRAVDFIKENGIGTIDVMKINIEGAEYGLLEDLQDNDMVKNIKNLQIQFHDFFPDSSKRMKNIHEKLKQTHELTFYHEFIWENWRLK